MVFTKEWKDFLKQYGEMLKGEQGDIALDESGDVEKNIEHPGIAPIIISVDNSTNHTFSLPLITESSIITMPVNQSTSVLQAQPVSTTPGKFSVSHLLRLLDSNICNVVFKKANGDIRIMRCTTNSNILKVKSYANTIPFTNDTYSFTTHQYISIDTIWVWDFDKNDWRSFRASSVQLVEIDPEDILV